MGCIVNNHFKVLYGHLKLLSVCSHSFGLSDTFEVLSSSMPVLPAIQTGLLLRGAATVSQILQASCLGILSVLVCACLLKLKSLVLFGAHWKNFGIIFSNVSTACLCVAHNGLMATFGGWGSQWWVSCFVSTYITFFAWQIILKMAYEESQGERNYLIRLFD